MNHLILILVTFFGFNVFSENVDEKIKKFILDNPEIILQSLENFEKKKIAEKKDLIIKLLLIIKNKSLIREMGCIVVTWKAKM